MLKTSISGAGRRHVPDYQLLTDLGPIVVDVKPRHRVDSPKVAFTLAWTRKVVESRGWRFEVWSEPPEIRLTNIRFLAGYRRDWLFDQGLLEELRKADLAAATLGDVRVSTASRNAACTVGGPSPAVASRTHYRSRLPAEQGQCLGGEGEVSGAATRVGVGTRFLYDGETVTVEEMVGSAGGRSTGQGWAGGEGCACPFANC
jgi:hypothetical protein